MNKDRWHEIEQIVDQALSIDNAKERTAFLNDRLANDDDLRREVTLLLDSIDASQGLWDDLLASNEMLVADMTHSDELGPAATLNSVPDQIGPYRIKQLLGRGGMGNVYLAERINSDFHQHVALKVLQREVQNEEANRRFLQERKILSTLNHPNIAGLLDGGISEGGRPYFVMEYVNGLPITEYCKKNDCSLHQRLDLFMQACQAVQYAHTNFIVHRDLKPDNLLVTPEGQVKILDFGIAKLLDRELSEDQLMQTKAGNRLLSLSFAAPEQITGEPVTAATDVYALGLLLYELLTGARAFNLKGKKLIDAEQIIRYKDPKKPSLCAEKWENKIKGDLDAIILKALRKKPEDRYESVNLLLEDIKRYNTNVPVRARKDTFGYLTGKFYRRNKPVIIAVILLIAALVSFAGYHFFQINEARKIAELEADKSQQVSDFLVGLFESSNPLVSTNFSITAEELLNQGITNVTQLADRPAIQAQMLEAIGRAQIGLGNYIQGDSLLNKALMIREEIHDPPHHDLATILDQKTHALQKLGKFASAESLARKALEMNRTLYGESHPKVAQSLHNLAFSLKAQSEYAPAESLYYEALKIHKKVHKDNHIDIAANLNNLGQLLTEQGKYVTADSLHREALRMRQELLGPDHPKTTESLNNIAQALEGQGRLAEAELFYRKGLNISIETLGSKHPLTVKIIHNLAVVVEQQGNLTEAETLKRQSLEIRKEILGIDHPDVTTAMNNLGVLLRKKGNYREAISLFRQVLERLDKQYGKGHPYVAFTSANLADVLREDGRFAAADSLYQTALIVIKNAFHEKHPHVATVLERYSNLKEKQENYATAESYLREALAIRQEGLGNHPRTAESFKKLANLLMKQEKNKLALPYYHEALSMNQKVLEQDNWRIASAMSDYGNALSLTNQYQKADSLLTKSYQLLNIQLGENDSKTQLAFQRLHEHEERKDKPKK